MLVLIPVPYYNFLIVFMSVFILLWFFRSIYRFLRVLTIRKAAINDSLVLIKDIGYNLISFENGSQTHMNALLHTRPTKPPTQMQILYLPIVISSTDIIPNKHNPNSSEVNLKIWLASKSFVMIFSKFKLLHFKRKFDDIKNIAISVINEISKTTGNDLSNIRRNEFTEMLVRYGICQHISSPLSLPAGEHQVNLPLHSSRSNS